MATNKATFTGAGGAGACDGFLFALTLAPTVMFALGVVELVDHLGGAVGVAASLYNSGTLNGTHLSILIPAIYLMGSQVQYMGRLLGTAEVQIRYYPLLFAVCIINSVISMLIMRLFV